MTLGEGRIAAEFLDPQVQASILLRLLLEDRPLSFRELATEVDCAASVVAGNCGVLRSKGWARPAIEGGLARVELTVSGTDAVRKMFPSAGGADTGPRG